jgi:hypothetical protein
VIAAISPAANVAPAGPVTAVVNAAPAPATQEIFAASYAPPIYAVFLNGLVASAMLEPNLSYIQLAHPPIWGSPVPQIPGLPPIQALPPVDWVPQVIAALTPLAGSGQIFSVAPVQTGAASTAGSQSSASRSTAPATTK